MSALIPDTHPKMEALQIELWRAASPTRKMQMLAQLDQSAHFNIIQRERKLKVDVFIPTPRPFLQSQLARVQKETFFFDSEVSAKFSSPEDIFQIPC